MSLPDTSYTFILHKQYKKDRLKKKLNQVDQTKGKNKLSAAMNAVINTKPLLWRLAPERTVLGSPVS